MSTFEDVGQARTYAAINGIDFDNQDDYCEACRSYHVGCGHEVAVPFECGQVALQGFNRVLECNRPTHEDDEHRTLSGTCWGGAPS